MNITVIGGGTVGSLITFYLQTSFPDIKITNIHSPAKDIIGVGEGMTGALRYFLFAYNARGRTQVISDQEFFKETKATIKLTIKYEDWGPIDYWSGFEENAIDPWDLSVYDAAKIHHNKATWFNRNSHWCQKNQTGFETVDDFDSPYGYHFDGNLISKFFLSKCNATKFIYDDVVDVTYHDDGHINELITKTGLKVETDFVIDCSGFYRVFQQKHDLKLTKIKSTLMNRAMPFLVPIKEDEEIDVFTTAKAMQYGWMWKIPVGNRYGMGYVYNKDLISDDDVLAEAETKLNRKIDPIKFIDWEPAISEKIWHKNVLMLGLSANFIEPLEATSIHGTISSFLNFLTHTTKIIDGKITIPKECFKNEILQNNYNGVINRLNRSYESFIQQHYLNPKYKTEFWNWYADKSNWTDMNRFLVEKGNAAHLVDLDFGETINGKPGPGLQYPTLLDLNLVKPPERGWAFSDGLPDFADRYNHDTYTMRSLQQYMY